MIVSTLLRGSLTTLHMVPALGYASGDTAATTNEPK